MEDVEEICFVPLTQVPPPLREGDASTSAPSTWRSQSKKVGAPGQTGRGGKETSKHNTAGSNWFELPATPITDEVKRDLRLLRLRGALDPKRHYKTWDQTKFPTNFQIGTVVEDAADFYSGRLSNKQRKGTLAEELLADTELTRMRKKRYSALQEETQRWSHKKVKKTERPRIKMKHKRPKH